MARRVRGRKPAGATRTRGHAEGASGARRLSRRSQPAPEPPAGLPGKIRQIVDAANAGDSTAGCTAEGKTIDAALGEGHRAWSRRHGGRCSRASRDDSGGGQWRSLRAHCRRLSPRRSAPLSRPLEDHDDSLAQIVGQTLQGMEAITASTSEIAAGNATCLAHRGAGQRWRRRPPRWKS